MKAACPKGTVLSADKAKAAIDAGGRVYRFARTQSRAGKVVQQNNRVIIPSCVTPTEIEQAMSHGLTTLKFFPADVYGGIKGCKVLHGSYHMVNFIPQVA